MSRSNGPGAPPNGWPADYRPNEAPDPYQDPYYTQQQRPAGQPPQQPSARAPRMQTAPPSRVPQTGLPPNMHQGGVPPQTYAPAYPGQPQTPVPGQAPTPGYGQQYAPPAQPHQQQPASPYAQPQQYAPPAQQPQSYAPPHQQAPAYAPQPAQPQQPRTQPVGAHHQAPQHDPRFPPFGGYDTPPTGRPTQPVQQPSQYPPAYTPAPSAYVPETTARPTQPPQQQRAPSPYDQQWQQPAPQQSAIPANDPRAYDLGHYQPSASPEPRTQRPTAPPAWTPHADPEAHQRASNLGLAPQFQASHLPQNQMPQNQALEPLHDDEYEDHEDDEEYDEAPRKTRYGLIAASLIAAIAAGGGLAYAYKMYVAPTAQTASAPVIKSNSGPIKVKPVDPGGTKFANADSKMMETLSGTTDGNTDGGPKAVKTIVVERDGSMASAQSTSPPSAAPAPVTSGGVPGMILANVPPPAPRPPQAAQPAAMAAVVNPPVAQQSPVRVTPKVVAAAPPPAAYPSAADPADTPPAAPVTSAPVKKVIPKKITPAAGPAPGAAPSAVGGPKGTSGFVAVLASVPASGSSRVEAMQQYADLQQKFGSVLGSKAPDVVEAKLEKGIYHRLIVGPPASRDAAGSICTQLKAAGYTADCWVTSF